MTTKRFTVHSEWRNLIADIKDTTGKIETLGEFVDLLNQLNEENVQLKLRINTLTEGNKTIQARLKEVSTENNNTKAVLEDFIDILNKIQVEPTDEKLLKVARDMLQNMDVNLER